MCVYRDLNSVVNNSHSYGTFQCMDNLASLSCSSYNGGGLGVKLYYYYATAEQLFPFLMIDDSCTVNFIDSHGLAST